MNDDRIASSSAGRLAAAVGRHPRALLLTFDGLIVLLTVAVFAQVYDPDILFHVLWLVLALQAFAFGLRVSGKRILLASVLVVAYAQLDATHLGPVQIDLHELDLEEWPLMFAIAVVVAVAADRVASTSRRYAALYQRASDRLITAQEDERRKLALDLHDGVGQTLAALVYTLDASESTLWAGPNPPSPLARSAIRRAQDLAAIALEDTRDVAYRLRPARFVEIGLVAGIEQLAKAMGARVHLDVDPDFAGPGLLDPQVEIDVYRVVQEALTNAVRHSHAKVIAVVVSSLDGRLLITIRDNGVGFRGAPRPTGLGIAGMRERAHVIDGDLRIESQPGVGTTVALAVPIPLAPEGGLPAALATRGAEMSR